MLCFEVLGAGQWWNHVFGSLKVEACDKMLIEDTKKGRELRRMRSLECCGLLVKVSWTFNNIMCCTDIDAAWTAQYHWMFGCIESSGGSFAAVGVSS